MRFSPILFSLISTSLMACGGGGEDALSSGGTLPNTTQRPALSSDPVPQVTVPSGSTKVIGSHGATLADIWSNQIRRTAGYEAPDGTVTLADGWSIFVGQSGYQNGIQTGDVGVIRLNDASQNYTFAKMYSGAITNAPGNVKYGILQGVYGQEAPSFSSNATVQYTGNAEANFSRASSLYNPYSLNNGTAEVEANFATGKAIALLTNFDATQSPIDTIAIRDMTINGGRFEGGELVTALGTTNVEALGSNSDFAASGAFFGDLNGAGVPIELGGTIYARGDSGTLSGAFIAKTTP